VEGGRLFPADNIKHFSLWLDILVVFKTVRIILTGWGAR